MDARGVLERKVICTEAASIAEALRLNKKILLLDSRPFMVFHTSHINTAINIGGNRAFQRKFSQNQVPLDLLLCKLTNVENPTELQKLPIVVYDECIDSLSSIGAECFLFFLFTQLTLRFPVVFLLKGGFLGFQASFPELCWLNTEKVAGEDIAEYHQRDCILEQILDTCLGCLSGTDPFSEISVHKFGTSSSANTTHPVYVPLTAPATSSFISFKCNLVPSKMPSIDQFSTEVSKTLSPELPVDIRSRSIVEMKVESAGATLSRPSPILPHLILGSQEDANSPTICKIYGITHILNVSLEGSIPSHISKQNFYRIPVNDNYTDLMTPYFKNAFTFIDSVKSAHGRVLIHCSAGISRSPTLAIAYLMYSCRMKMHEAYATTSTFGSHANISTESQSSSVLKSDPALSSFSFTLTPTSPKVSSKKRERPTYLGLEATSSFEGPLEGRAKKSSMPYGGLVKSIPDSGISPTEEKRSRVSALLSPTQSSSVLLPSPCTGLSKLEISSPLEEFRTLLSASRAPSSLSPGHFLPGPEPSLQMLKFRPFLSSSTSLQTLRFEPCSTVLPPHPIQLTTALSPASILRLRRSSSTVATVRPTLLAHRRLSSHASAPPTPRPVSTERSHVVYPSVLRGHESFHLPSYLSSTSSPSRVKVLSPSNPVSQEPKLEYEQLQKCDVNFDVNRSVETQVVSAKYLRFASYCQKRPNPLVNLLRSHSNENVNKNYLRNNKSQEHLITSTSRCVNFSYTYNSSNLSRSAPSQRDTDLVFFSDQGFTNSPSCLFSQCQSLPLPNELISSSLIESRKFDTGQSSANIRLTNVATAVRLLPQVAGADTSCRRQHQSFEQSSGSSSPSSSTGHNSPHNSSSYSLFPIS
ncbi:Dual specificity protein phosphatase 8 [Schistosoma japonicum]|uniref:protein-tyrosine-phosphatase n=3 Tax=Schistosoma japonicum TaxID=6182 RepID=A0A4Z2CTF1_SCHJA|nr:Dual specificity protein phosphatase 8 [Schistosoma japonicum]